MNGLSRWLVRVSLAAVAVATPSIAHADEKQACLAASEKAQQLRNAGKLTDAREQLVVCGRAECPRVVQQDCTTWMGEILQILPTVIPAAKDRKGRDLVDVKMAIDGKPAADVLDGKPIAVDPGVHAFHFETKGGAPIDQQVVVRQGEKNRILPVTFPIGDDEAGGGGTGGGGSNSGGGASSGGDSSGSSPPILGFALGGAGLVLGGVALYVGLSADADGRNLRDTCAPKCAQSDVDDVQHRQNLAVYLGVGAGVLFVAGAALVIIHYASSGSKSGKALLPSMLTLAPAPGGAATVLSF